MELEKGFLQTSSESDKITHHGYHRIYPWFLEHFRGRDVQLLEVGLELKKSVKLWKNYFENVTIHAIDIKKDIGDTEDFLYFRVDQSDEGQLHEFAKDKVGKFDIIIDDGSHIPMHQRLTLKMLWPTLKEGGVYIIEDIETSYWGKSMLYGYEFDSKKYSIVKDVLGLAELVNSEFQPAIRERAKSHFLFPAVSDSEMVSFAYNSMILVKRQSKFNSFYDREYKLKSKIGKLSFSRRFQKRIERMFKGIKGTD